jgi:hypothetical protein
MTSKTPPKYNLAIVEAVCLREVAELHPRHLTAKDLLLRIISDDKDSKEVETAIQAIRNLCEFGLFSDRGDDIVEPTIAALHAVTLLREGG